MKKVFFGGSRRLGRLNQKVQEHAANIIAERLQVLVGDANGADKAIQMFFAEKGYLNVVVFFAGAVCRNNLVGHASGEGRPVRTRFSFLRSKGSGNERGGGLRVHDMGWREPRYSEQHP